MKQFLFSFIITTGNVKSYLVELMESVIAQTVGFVENIQIVLLHNTSSDDMETVCENYRNLYPDNILSIADLVNHSLTSLRNAGFRVATGRYINLLNSGEKWDKEACQAALDFFQKNQKIRIACFPIMMFGTSKGKHWLNYKFTKTRVANIFKDTDCVVLDLCSCFCTLEVVKDQFLKRPFLEASHPASEETFWIAKVLLDEQNFGLLAKPYCRCRFDRSAGIKEKDCCFSYALDTLNYAKEKHGEIILWAQYAVMMNLTWVVKEKDQGILTPSQREEYRGLMRICLTLIDDQVILAVNNLWTEERLLALSIKYNMTYEHMQEFVKPDESLNALCFCRPSAPSLKLTPIIPLRLEFIEIAEGKLLLRGLSAR